jgi:hypothetical protein
LDEALHVGGSIVTPGASINLEIDTGKMMVWIVVKLAFKLGGCLHSHDSPVGIGIRFVARKAVDLGIFGLQGSEHVVERAILHH